MSRVQIGRSSRSWLISQTHMLPSITWDAPGTICGYDVLRFEHGVLACAFLKRFPHDVECSVFLSSSSGELLGHSDIDASSCHIPEHLCIGGSVPTAEGAFIRIRYTSSSADGDTIDFTSDITAVELLSSMPHESSCIVEIINWAGHIIGHSHFWMNKRFQGVVCVPPASKLRRTWGVGNYKLKKCAPPLASVDNPACTVVSCLKYFL